MIDGRTRLHTDEDGENGEMVKLPLRLLVFDWPKYRRTRCNGAPTAEYTVNAAPSCLREPLGRWHAWIKECDRSLGNELAIIRTIDCTMKLTQDIRDH